MDQSSSIIGPVGSTPDRVPDRQATPRPAVSAQSADASEPATTTKNVDDKALREALTRAQEVVHQVDPRIQIEIDQDLHRPVMKVVDNQTGALIRQIPAEEMLDIAKRLDAVEGILFKGRV